MKIIIKGNKSVTGLLEKYKNEELQGLEDSAWVEACGEFDEQILSDLISQGLSGEELLGEFKRIRQEVRPAVEAMVEDARLAAEGKIKSYSYDDIF